MTDSELIESLGGSTKLARRLGMTVQRVNNWRARGIPSLVKLQNPFLHKPRRKRINNVNPPMGV